jgi:uncharacterized protein
MSACSPASREWPDNAAETISLTPGWSPTHFREYVLKIHGRCNLRCSYCYMYSMADQDWRSRPVKMAPRTITQTASRLAHYVTTAQLDQVSVIFHGGEPLLAGTDLIAFAAAEFRAAIPLGTRLRLSIQTNGTLLSHDVLSVLLDHDISVGVSLDGQQGDNDRHRRYADGRGSHRHVLEGLALLRSEPFCRLFAGLLCTVDLAADPIATFEALAECGPPIIDFLMPHGNWTNRPVGRGPDPALTPYGDWLIAIFDRWYATAAPRIRLFEEIIQLCLGGRSRSEAVGLSPAAMIVVNVDGSLEQVDTLRSTFAGAVSTGLNIFTHGFEAALNHPSIVARQIGAAALGETCGCCSLRRICGGGYYPHRYRSGSGFRNPSVYCPDLIRLITHVRGRLAADLKAVAIA